jgi:hypothetical protein
METHLDSARDDSRLVLITRQSEGLSGSVAKHRAAREGCQANANIGSGTKGAKNVRSLSVGKDDRVEALHGGPVVSQGRRSSHQQVAHRSYTTDDAPDMSLGSGLVDLLVV